MRIGTHSKKLLCFSNPFPCLRSRLSCLSSNSFNFGFCGFLFALGAPVFVMDHLWYSWAAGSNTSHNPGETFNPSAGKSFETFWNTYHVLPPNHLYPKLTTQGETNKQMHFNLQKQSRWEAVDIPTSSVVQDEVKHPSGLGSNMATSNTAQCHFPQPMVPSSGQVTINHPRHASVPVKLDTR